MKAFLPALLFLFAAGCRPATHAYVPTPPPKVEPAPTEVAGGAAVMPLAVGNRWTYSLRTEAYDGSKPLGRNEETVIYRVKARYGKNDQDAYLTLEASGRTIDLQDWRTTDAGVYQLSSGAKRTAYSPPQPLILVPMTPGRRFEWKGRGAMPDSSIGQGSAKNEILPSQTVDTGMGPMSAIPVVSRMSFAGGQSENTSWFRPGVGLVRFRQETVGKGRRVVLLLTLTSYALQKS